MPTRKKCGSEQAVKSGAVAGTQRYKGKVRGCTFREGDACTNEMAAARKALCILPYTVAKGSFRMMGKILKTDYALVYRCIHLRDMMIEPA
jgi:transposase-like protein